MSFKIERIKDKNCSKCDEVACMKLEEQETGIIQYLCPKHYILNEGEHDIKQDLEFATSHQTFNFWSPKLAKLVSKKFPELGDKYGRTLRKIIQTQSKRPKIKNNQEV